MATTFTAQMAAFATQTKERMELVVKQSAQDVAELAQRDRASRARRPKKGIAPAVGGGNLPVDVGFLRNSLVAGLNGSTSLKGPDSYVLAIAGMELGDSVIFGWSAEYARFVEYGANGVPGAFFALRAAQEWQQIVARNAEKARAQ